MTLKEFKFAMLRGQGRCVLQVRDDPEKYRKQVLWACKHNLSFDTQCEGVRGWYVYQMVLCYQDTETFLDTVIQELRKFRGRDVWQLSHLIGLLGWFMHDGSQIARDALVEKYQMYLTILRQRKSRRDYIVFLELECLTSIAMELTVDSKAALSIAEDLGNLYQVKSYLYDGEFLELYDWFKPYHITLERAAKCSSAISCFLERERRYIEKPFVRPAPNPEYVSALQGDMESLKLLAERYRETPEPERRADALRVFTRRMYPDDPQPIIQDTQSDCEKLSMAANAVLEKIRHPKVRQLALDFLDKGQLLDGIALLAENFEPGDVVLFEESLRDILLHNDVHELHGACMSVLHGIQHNYIGEELRRFLPLIYEITPCAQCRERAVRLMGRHRMLSQELLEECVFDSNEDIRVYARRCLNRRKTRDWR